MIRHLGSQGVRVPAGFATTAHAYRQFIAENELEPRIRALTGAFDRGERSLAETCQAIRDLVLAAQIPAPLAEAVRDAYRELAAKSEREAPDVAVRSSATAEDLPEASFAGQQETFLNIRGEGALLAACRRCFASLFTDRAIAYREDQDFDQLQVALSIGIQTMVRADTGCSGVMFSLDTDTGFPRTVLINGAWGWGETVVQGMVDPDEYLVFKPLLDDDSLVPIVSRHAGGKEKKMVYAESGEQATVLVDTSPEERRTLVLGEDEVLTLARWAVTIEWHYGKPMDMEWAKDGETGDLFIVQARPETVHSQRAAGTLKTYRMIEKGEELTKGYTIGEAIAAGRVCRLASADASDRFEDGGVLVTGMTDPDWVPIMRRAAAIVTDHGGRTSHAAIVSRELGLPAVVGTEDGTERLEDGAEITASCAEGETGRVYAGIADFEAEEIDFEQVPETRTRIMLNMANPAAAMRWWRLPSDGVGLARMEFIINQDIKIHLYYVAEEALQEANRRKDAFLATLAHELRNPLMPIRSSLDLLRMLRGNATACGESLRIMDRQVNHLVRLIDDLLDVSRISRGKIELRKERLDLAEIIDAALDMGESGLSRRDPHLTVSVPSQPLPAEGDRVRLVQIVSNLLNNAGKFTDADGHIGLRVVPQGDRVEIRVQDDGRGRRASINTSSSRWELRS
jgi:pyruvate,water dikinase